MVVDAVPLLGQETAELQKQRGPQSEAVAQLEQQAARLEAQVPAVGFLVGGAAAACQGYHSLVRV